jgi:hypothetical protein
VQTFTRGRVDGVQYTAEGPVLTIGGMRRPLIERGRSHEQLSDE